MSENEKHPDLLEIDAVRAGEAESAHLEGCGVCRAELEELRKLESVRGPEIEVPSAVDRAVLDMGAKQLRRPRVFWFPLAAAAAVLAVSIPFLTQTSPREDMAARPEDIDKSGTVDILDAYVLASRIESGEQLEPGWDLNKDGVVDEEDVEIIARESVSLRREG